MFEKNKPKNKKKGRENFPYFASTSYQLFLEKKYLHLLKP